MSEGMTPRIPNLGSTWRLVSYTPGRYIPGEMP
jgi:hypothetical protein